MAKEKILQDWEKVYGQPISEETYKEICSNLDSFFSVLRKWNKEYNSNQTKNNEAISEQ